MFKCQHCSKPSAFEEQPVRIITETRKRTYPSGTIGREVVREILVHDACVADAQAVADAAEARREQRAAQLAADQATAAPSDR